MGLGNGDHVIFHICGENGGVGGIVKVFAVQATP